MFERATAETCKNWGQDFAEGMLEDKSEYHRLQDPVGVGTGEQVAKP